MLNEILELDRKIEIFYCFMGYNLNYFLIFKFSILTKMEVLGKS